MAKRNKKKKSRSRSHTKGHSPKTLPQEQDSQGVPASSTSGQETASVDLQPFDQGPRFSVLMAAYNRAELIHVAIDSVLAQDFSDYELVIVDDGSTDETPSVVAGYSDPRIRYIRKELNEGRSPTRNRAISEARGEFVLWMADDDLLEPHLLGLYDGIMTAEPHIDVIYGKLQLFDHDTGQDLNVFTPNDWTGRDDEVVGAKLYGSCVPDGGSAVRRTLYGKVGSGPYDDEFVRAQDYELWTRIVGHAKFRFVDEIVYRYRKHEGGTSWGEFIDLTLDSKIIRRHLRRHPLKRLFPRLNWKRPRQAESHALLRVAKNLQMYGDHENVLRFIHAIPGHNSWPEAIDYRVRAYLAMGDLERSGELIRAAEDTLGYRDQRIESLKAILAWLTRFSQEAPAAIEAGHLAAVIEDAMNFHTRHFPAYLTMKYRAQAHEELGQVELALHTYCLAALNLRDDACAQGTERLRALVGPSPKTDLTAMRRRLREEHFPLPVYDEEPVVDEPLVSVLFMEQDSSDEAMCIGALLGQTYTRFEVLSHRKIGPTGDARFRCLDETEDLLSAATGQYIAWLETDVIWSSLFLQRAVATLSAGHTAVGFLGHVASDPDGQIWETECLKDDVLSLSSLMDTPNLSLAHLVHRRPESGDPQWPSHAHGAWHFLMAWLSGNAWTLHSSMSVTRRRSPSLGTPVGGFDSLSSLMEVYRHFGSPTAFDLAARDAQNRRLHPLSFHQVRRGKSMVLILGAQNLVECQQTISELRRVTWAAHDFLLVLDHFESGDIDALSEWISSQEDVRAFRSKGHSSEAKQFNDALSRAHSEYVAFLQVGVLPSEGWLGRLQYHLHSHASSGWATPSFAVPASDVSDSQHVYPTEVPDQRCGVLHRRVIDRIGGMDVTLGAPGYDWFDYAFRMRLAGFVHQAVSMVQVGGTGYISERNRVGEERFIRRWGGLNPDLSTRQFQKEHHFCPVGAETGFRPDGRPIEVLESAGQNVLIVPPWDDRTAMLNLMARLQKGSQDLAFWFRAPVGEGSRYAAELRQHWNDTERAPSEQPTFLIIDAHLAPEREAGVYLAVHAVFVDETWGNARQSMRRASDCGRRILRGHDELAAWVEANTER